MQFSCDKTELLAAILTSQRAAAVRSPVPALEGLLIAADFEVVKISGYDLKIGITTTISAEVASQGTILLNARLFGEIVRKLPDSTVTITADENQIVKIFCDYSEFEIIGSPASDYPDLPYVSEEATVIISGNTLKKMIGQTVFAVSDNETRPSYTGELFEIENGVLTVVAVDGYRMALRREETENKDAPACSFIVPGVTLAEIGKIFCDDDELVHISLSDKQIMFLFHDTVLISRRLEGEFLDYKKSIPPSFGIEIEVERRSLYEAVERISLLINDKIKSPVRFVFGDRELNMSTVSSLGRASDKVEISADGDNLEIGFNNRYIIDALKAAPADRVKLCLTTGVTPCLIKSVDGDESFLYLILPVRLKNNEG